MKKTKLAYNTIIIIILLAGIGWVSMHFIHLGKVEYTDNAQVKQQLVPVNTRVQGYVSKIYFDEYRHVKKGDTLLIIEDTEYRYRVAQAEADYQNAVAGRQAMGKSVHSAQSNIEVTDAALAESKVRLDNAEKDYMRYNNLLDQQSVTKQQFDAMKSNYDAAKARYQQVLRQRNTSSLVKDEQALRLNQNDAQIKLAKAAVELARLNLSYTVIVAPCDGVTGRKNVEEGQLLQAGQAVVDLVNDKKKWVVANYKETQTARIKPGQEVEIKVDALPNKAYKGIVSSISLATGASFSLFPQDNSAGNFVKVEQRIPVRIEFTTENTPDALSALRSGMNVECEVRN